ncbi:protein serine/threonine kinase activating protein DBF4 LALA0_S06e04808g [Lachancea lanzarotensis]|uniref:LALA0S06e04808g1_1 n=1 Tax=Lachancea lanzarotensis TaxID=1245769 RepID=A0A0C7MS99_9SACH|nr:uncharacterized protein LALA0_S06e04808g [Lachancea lanzarotensis]CEP62830.1 LALA0S06e04808g1_1 [Lachancea lanzarotensis]
MFTSKRSPLTETDSNVKTGPNVVVKKRTVERIDVSQARKKPRVGMEATARARTIEGAVQQPNHSQQSSHQNQQIAAKVTPQDLLEWQTNWRRIMRRDTKIYFDTTEALHKNDKKREALKRAFLSLGAQITAFFDTDVTVVVTQRVLRDYDRLPDTDVLARAAKRYMKIWNYEKATRFLHNLDVDVDALETKTTALAPSTLSNLLHNEKLYGPADRDPKARRDDVHYFKHAYVYLYDLWQVWAPVIVAEWRPQDGASHPTVRPGSFGRCPFIGDGQCDEQSGRRILKRYRRDYANEKYALRLRLLYQRSADPQTILSRKTEAHYDMGNENENDNENENENEHGDDYEQEHEYSDNTDSVRRLLMLPHEYCNSYEQHQNLMGTPQNAVSPQKSCSHREKECINTGTVTTTTLTQHPSGQNHNQELLSRDTSLHVTASAHHRPSKVTWSVPNAFVRQAPGSLARQDTEEAPLDDLCGRKSRIPHEIRASGVVQSNDGVGSISATGSVVGNGLGPTRASVTSKNLKSLNRLVVDKKFTAEAKLQKPTPTTTTITTTTTTTASTNAATHTPRPAPSTHTPDARKPRNDAKAGPGYCENCRVKYESLTEHIDSEKHRQFAGDDRNFEAVDFLIRKLADSRA